MKPCSNDGISSKKSMKGLGCDRSDAIVDEYKKIIPGSYAEFGLVRRGKTRGQWGTK